MSNLSRSRRTARRKKQKVPDLVGLQLRDARLVLSHRGFYDPNLLGTPREGEAQVEVRYTKDFAPYGTVVAQHPSKGQIIDSDEAIQLTVSMESLLDYLPGVYKRRDAVGGNFIQEFLWIFQHVFHSIESKIDRIHDYFDVFETPEEFLPWLAGWVAFSLDGDWSESQRRLFLKRAVELYRIRGTVRGLKTFIEMYTGVTPEILENKWPLDGFQIGVASTIGPDSAILPPINRAHCFMVEVPLDADEVDDDQIIKIHQIITSQKPAHTTYYLRFTGRKQKQTRWAGPVIGQYRVTSAQVVEGTAADEASARADESEAVPGASSRLTEEEGQAAMRDARQARGEEEALKPRKRKRKTKAEKEAEAAAKAEAEKEAKASPADDTAKAKDEAKAARAAARAARRAALKQKAKESVKASATSETPSTEGEGEGEGAAKTTKRSTKRSKTKRAATKKSTTKRATTKRSTTKRSTTKRSTTKRASGKKAAGDASGRAETRAARRARIKAALEEDKKTTKKTTKTTKRSRSKRSKKSSEDKDE